MTGWAPGETAHRLFDRFFVAAAASWVLTRAYLALTGYPRIGGHGLHISHLLWGGLLMLAALIALLGFLGQAVRDWSAVIGGAGWGLFIDELGKFITSDVNYFYQPALPLIYASFIILYLILRELANRVRISPALALARAIDILQNAPLGGLNAAQLDQAHRLLLQANPANPLTAPLLGVVHVMAATPATRGGLWGRLNAGIAGRYRVLRDSRGFIPVAVALAVVASVTNLADLITQFMHLDDGRQAGFDPGLMTMVKAAGVAASSVLLLLGACWIGRAPLQGFRWMRTGLLVALLLVQPLSFYTAQVVGLWGLAFHLLLLLVVDDAITRERGISSELVFQTARG